MKTSDYCRALLFTGLLMFIADALQAQKEERSISRDFKFNPGTTLTIDSKFGNVNILNTDDNTIKIDASIWVKSDNPKLAGDLANKLDVQIKEAGNEITVISVFPDKLPSMDKTQLGIDFTIHVPASVDLNLKNRYGSVYIEEISGLANISVAFGTIKAQILSRGKAGTLNALTLDHSTGSIGETAWLKLNLINSKLSISEATALVVISQYSGLNVDECSSLVVESKYDTYRVGELKNYVGDLKYSNLSADEILDKFEITSAYSVVKVDEIGKDFQTIKIDNTRGSYKLGINAESSFSINASAMRGEIAVNGVENLSKRIENADKFISGTYGSDPKAKVDIKVTEGSLKINVE